jgi:hypothetical protein
MRKYCDCEKMYYVVIIDSHVFSAPKYGKLCFLNAVLFLSVYLFTLLVPEQLDRFYSYLVLAVYPFEVSA